MGARTAPVLGLAFVLLLVLAGSAGGGPAAPAAFLIGNDAPAWSPDGTQIAFTAFRHGNGEIYVMNPDGTGQRRITNHVAHDDHAAWSPDGTRIAFASTRAGNYEIYTVKADGSDLRRLTNHPRNDFSPTWSPDGARIAWRSDRDGDGEIYSMNVDGTDERRLTFNTGSDQAPDWGPDGRIAFISIRGSGALNVFTMEGDGSDVRLVTRGGTFNKERPNWSPDGSKIMFVAEGQLPLGNTEIYVVNADGTGLQRLTTFEGRDDWPAWAPDGARFLFSRGFTFRSPEIYVANIDGTGVTKLTSTARKLEIVDAFAPAPRAGMRWTAFVVVRDSQDAPLGAMTPICRATLAGKAIRPVGRLALRDGTGACAWNVPKNARGKLLRGVIGVREGTLRVEQPFALRVR